MPPTPSFSSSAPVWLCLLLFAVWQADHHAAILRVGTPLPWASARPHLNDVRTSGAKQFLNHYMRSKCIETPLFLWGDEIEYGVLGRQQETGHFDLSLRGTEIREYLTSLESNTSTSSFGSQWQPEYGAWMVEAVPRDPYSGYVSDLLNVEKSMQWRRKRLHYALKPSEIAPSASNFPMLGVLGKGYAHTGELEGVAGSGPVANSAFLSDLVINPHPRMQALTQNIRSRRGSNVCIKLPLDTDANTDKQPQQNLELDAMAFGMGCCCLQVTMQCKSDSESRFLHDQLVTFSPLMLALSAATPAFQGRLLGTDTRWQAISDAVDDRTTAERGLLQDTTLSSSNSPSKTQQVDPCLVGGGVRRLLKSRYSSVSRYIMNPATPDEMKAVDSLNNLDAGIDEDILQMLLHGGMDWNLAMHVAHLFTRDPLVIFDDAISLDDQRVLDHFENIQSTNWRTIRWKPPCLAMGLAQGTGPYGQHKTASAEQLQALGPGWRVEFRPLEVQLTDFENAAFAIATVLLSRAILAMGFNFYLPLSLVDENMRRAQLKNAALEQKFWIRRRALSPLPSKKPSVQGMGPRIRLTVPSESHEAGDYVELTLDEIFNGASSPEEEVFPGLLPAVVGYLESIGCSRLTIGRLQPYLALLAGRASGAIPTTASFLRSQYLKHQDYRGDGVISPSMADDVMLLCDKIGMGQADAKIIKGLVGSAFIQRLCPEDIEADSVYLVGVADPEKAAETVGECPDVVPCKSYVPTNTCVGSKSALTNSGDKIDYYLDGWDFDEFSAALQ